MVNRKGHATKRQVFLLDSCAKSWIYFKFTLCISMCVIVIPHCPSPDCSMHVCFVIPGCTCTSILEIGDAENDLLETDPEEGEVVEKLT